MYTPPVNILQAVLRLGLCESSVLRLYSSTPPSIFLLSTRVGLLDWHEHSFWPATQLSLKCFNCWGLPLIQTFYTRILPLNSTGDFLCVIRRNGSCGC